MATTTDPSMSTGDHGPSGPGGPGPVGEPSGPSDDWGPVVASGGPRRRRWPRWLLVALIVVLVVPLGWGLAVANHAANSMQRQQVTGLSQRSGSRMNVLITGSDSRADLTAEERNELTTGTAEGERTDSIMILSVQGSTAQLLAFPRDLWVERCDGSTGRINASLQHGGPGCLVETVRDLSGIPIHHMIAVRFGGFRDLVDAVGGVEMCTDKDLVDPKAGIDLVAGCHTLDGVTSLAFVRTRQLDSDLFRIGRQQQFIAALTRAVVTRETITNPVQTWEVSGAAGAALVADQDLGLADLLRLAWGARGLRGGLDAQTVPGTPATIGGAEVLEPDLAAAEELFAPLRGDAPIDSAQDPTDGPGASVDRGDVQVAVLNGASVNGLAGTVGDALTGAGYDVVSITNGPATPDTTIVHAPGQGAAARRLVGDLPGNPSVEEATKVGDLSLADVGADVALLLGGEVTVTPTGG